MTKIFYMMRHGQTRFNQQQRIQGACDSPLTALGIEQAQAACDYFVAEEIAFTKVYSSTQERAVDTAEIASGRTDIIRRKGLKEMDFGAFEGQQEFLNPPFKRDGSGYGDYFVTYGGEDSVAVRERVHAAMQEIMAENKDNDDTILVVSHGGAIAQFYRHYAKTSPQLKTRISNCAIFKMTFEDGEFDLLSIYDPVHKLYLFEKV
ncbi:histidine phosphatase family protein [Streptococcus sp. S784/96/1]|uniref:histidine phosphatase family protein n=1 Tax=Streptococcus sp. S784/96/1 TaxID=2653499 RepID=UPI0013899BE2|nr:histidine phosphatase family protein [Streptococcus sp. S784/96/1]